MASLPAGPEIERLIQLLSKLPGLGPRSARRAALALLKKREAAARAAGEFAARSGRCNLRLRNLRQPRYDQPLAALCRDPRRENHILCIVEDVADLWALERANVFRGLRYHVLGGALSALDGITPERLNLAPLLDRTKGVEEVILAMNAKPSKVRRRRTI